ncbi:MAG TPA: hypothetical protein VNQ76_15575, partial [Planctomicrobium sp.]|nr:hypothetical protein [Planctomicrobium sp.]
MAIEPVRPSIAETSYRFFDRPLHPELFSPAVIGRLKTGKYEMSLGICRGGHYLQMTSNGKTVAEVTGPDSEVLATYGLQQTYFFNDQEELVLEATVPLNYHF